MVTALGGVLRSTSDKDFAIVRLDGAETDRDIEIDIQQLSGLFILVDIVVMDCPLIKLKVVNAIYCVSQAWVLLTKATPIILHLRHGSLHHLQTGLVELIQLRPHRDVTRDSLSIRLIGI